jgi:hypothetical protein
MYAAQIVLIAGFGIAGVESTIIDLFILRHISTIVKLHQKVTVHLNAEASMTTEDAAQNTACNKQNSVVLVRKRTIPNRATAVCRRS